MQISKAVARVLFFTGALVYLAGLWYSCPLLSGKGYFLGVLMTGTFVTYSYLRAERFGNIDETFSRICQFVALLNVYEIVIYPVAFFVSIFGQIKLMRAE